MNNAFRHTARLALNTSQRRFQSTTTPEISTTFLTVAKKKGNFRNNWLSDPSTYPLLFCLGAACGLCVGVAGYFLTCCKDVQINTKNRASVIRTWGA